MAYQHQHVWNCDIIGFVSCRHGRLKVVTSVFQVGHCVVGMKCDVVFLDAFSDKKANIQILYVCRDSLQWQGHI